MFGWMIIGFGIYIVYRILVALDRITDNTPQDVEAAATRRVVDEHKRQIAILKAETALLADVHSFSEENRVGIWIALGNDIETANTPEAKAAVVAWVQQLSDRIRESINDQLNDQVAQGAPIGPFWKDLGNGLGQSSDKKFI